jgi:hypothetical protein
MTRRKAKNQAREEASTYVAPPPGICGNCLEELDDPITHCPMTGCCVSECECDEHMPGGPW